MKRSIAIAIGIALALGIIIIGGIRIIKANTLTSALPAESRVALLNEKLESRQLNTLDELDQLDQLRLRATLNATVLNSLDRLKLLDNNGAPSPRVLGDRLDLNLLADLS